MNQEENKRRGRPVGTFKPKMNDAELQSFMLESIHQVLDNHMSWKEYINFCFGYGLSTTQANQYWKRVWEAVREKYELDKDKLITKHIKKYWQIYDQSYRNGDMNTARQTLNDLGKMMGLNEPDKVEIQASNKVIEFKFGTPE